MRSILRITDRAREMSVCVVREHFSELHSGFASRLFNYGGGVSSKRYRGLDSGKTLFRISLGCGVSNGYPGWLVPSRADLLDSTGQLPPPQLSATFTVRRVSWLQNRSSHPTHPSPLLGFSSAPHSFPPPKEEVSWVWSAMMEHLPNTQEALGSREKKKKKS